MSRNTGASPCAAAGAALGPLDDFDQLNMNPPFVFCLETSGRTGRGSRISRPDEYPLVVRRGGLVEPVAVAVESLQVLDPFHPLVDGEPGHGPAGLLGEEGDDAALAILL